MLAWLTCLIKTWLKCLTKTVSSPSHVLHVSLAHMSHQNLTHMSHQICLFSFTCPSSQLFSLISSILSLLHISSIPSFLTCLIKTVSSSHVLHASLPHMSHQNCLFFTCPPC